MTSTALSAMPSTWTTCRPRSPRCTAQREASNELVISSPTTSTNVPWIFSPASRYSSLQKPKTRSLASTDYSAPPDRAAFLKQDYTLSPVDVYTQVAIDCIKMEDNLDVLSLGGVDCLPAHSKLPT